MILLICLMVVFSLEAVIIEVSDLSRFEEEVSRLDKNALVLFDIDYTILTPKDLALKPCGKVLRRRFLHGLGIKQREHLQSIIALEGEEELMDDAFPLIIGNLKKANIHAIGLTALETGAYGKIARVEDWRLSQLKKLDIDFTPVFSKNDPIQFEEKNPYNGQTPMFKKGVLFTNRLPKGQVLEAFLQVIAWKPDCIVFIDDAIEQLQSVEALAKALKIEFFGFHYVAAEVKSCVLDQALGEFQFKNLVEKERWLPDDQAREMLIIENSSITHVKVHSIEER